MTRFSAFVWGWAAGIWTLRLLLENGVVHL